MKKNTNATPKKKGLFHREAMQETILLCLFLAIMLVLAFTPLGMIDHHHRREPLRNQKRRGRLRIMRSNIIMKA